VLVVVWRLAWPAVLEGGAGLRARHRWAASEVELDGRRRLLLWAPAPPLAAQSPLAGSPEGVHVRVDGGGLPTPLRLRVGGGPLPAGRYAFHFRLEAPSAARFTLAGKIAMIGASTPVAFETEIDHPGGPMALSAATDGAVPGTVWIGDAKIVTLR
jgi:hypothetical protein